MKLNAFAAVALLGGLVFASSVYSQPAQTGGPTPSPPGAKEEFVDLKDWSEDHDPFRASMEWASRRPERRKRTPGTIIS